MSRRIFLFPGQGSQKVGMAADLVAGFDIARQTFEEASDALGFNIQALCAQGPEEELKLTQNAPPAFASIPKCSVMNKSTKVSK